MSTSSSLQTAQALLREAQYAVALTGAGMSTPSGIPDFRSPNSGLWANVNPMQVASIGAFRQQPQDFYNWLYPISALILNACPNPAHFALAHLEAHGPLKAVITQNIDILHSKAGSHTVYEAHGHLRQATCLHCDGHFEATPYLEAFVLSKIMPRCPVCGHVLKPDVVLFGELLPVAVLKAAEQAVRRCDLMIVAGSSLEVAPIGDLPLLAKQSRAHLVIVNLSETHYDDLADVVIRADVAEVLPQLAATFTP